MFSAVKLLEGWGEKSSMCGTKTQLKGGNVDFQVSSLHYLLPSFNRISNAEDYCFLGRSKCSNITVIAEQVVSGHSSQDSCDLLMSFAA